MAVLDARDARYELRERLCERVAEADGTAGALAWLVAHSETVGRGLVTVDRLSEARVFLLDDDLSTEEALGCARVLYDLGRVDEADDVLTATMLATCGVVGVPQPWGGVASVGQAWGANRPPS